MGVVSGQGESSIVAAAQVGFRCSRLTVFPPTGPPGNDGRSLVPTEFNRRGRRGGVNGDPPDSAGFDPKSSTPDPGSSDSKGEVVFLSTSSGRAQEPWLLGLNAI